MTKKSATLFNEQIDHAVEIIYGDLMPGAKTYERAAEEWATDRDFADAVQRLQSSWNDFGSPTPSPTSEEDWETVLWCALRVPRGETAAFLRRELSETEWMIEENCARGRC